MSTGLSALPRPGASRGWLQRLRPSGRIDGVLLGSVLALTAIGGVLVWSATRQRMIAIGGDPESFVKRHAVYAVLGFVLAMLAVRIDGRNLRSLAPVAYLTTLAGLVLVLIIGSTINGAKAWIVLPAGFAIQPSEFAKIGLILAVAAALAGADGWGAQGRRADDRAAARILTSLVVVGIPAALVLLQNDLGTVLVMIAIFGGMLLVSGAPMRWLAGLVLAGVVAAGLAVASGALGEYQVQRLVSFADPSADPQGAGYNTRQARIAVGSGGLTGAGLFDGAQTQGRFVPEQQTDFIFTVVAEELGFLGGATVLLLFAAVLWRACAIAANAPDQFGRLVAVGIVCWFGFHMYENIGMSLGIMPVTGVPLPFVSYGGSSMLANWLAVALLLNVHRHTR